MGLKEMQIVFDNPWATYYTGGTVNGQLILRLDSPKKVRDISVQFKGECNVNWTETESVRDNDGNSKDETVIYKSEEKYFENKFKLLGGGGSDVEVPAGEHQYPFQTILPPSLPSSFESEFGHVRYTVKCVLNRPWKFDQEAKAAFTVISPVDLNYNMEARYPIKKEEEKQLGCCCFQSGLLFASIEAPVTGYVSGQQIPVTIKVDNMSTSQVNGLVCQLRKVVKYTAKSPSTKEKEVKVDIADVKLKGVGAQSKETYSEILTIPALPPSNLQNCTLIDLKYELKLEVKVSGLFVRNLSLKNQVIIGTVPLAVQQQQEQPVTSQPEQPQVQVGWTSPENFNNQLYPELPPPTYEESSMGKFGIMDQHDNEFTKMTETFAPRYPSYQIPAPSAPLFPN